MTPAVFKAATACGRAVNISLARPTVARHRTAFAVGSRIVRRDPRPRVTKQALAFYRPRGQRALCTKRLDGKGVSTMDRDQVVQRVLEDVKPFTMVHVDGLAATISLTLAAIDEDLPGDLVECGTWMGGCSFAMLLAQRYVYGRIVKPVWMFDSFQGLPPVDERDGPSAAAWQSRTDSEWYFDNCKAPIETVRAAVRNFGFAEAEVSIIPGWFEDTLSVHRPALEARGIAVLRVDCDWYEPVTCVLDQLGTLVVDEGKIIIDDYFFWDGCARAVHDHLSRNDLPWRIRSIGTDVHVGAWMIKRPFRSEHQAS